MKNKITLGFIMILTTLMLTGCWDSVEINKRHVVMEIAIDKGRADDIESEVDDREYYEITYMIPDMQKLSGEESLAENVKTAMQVKSPTLAKSVDDVETKTQNTLTFSHTKALIFGEELLKDKTLFRAAVDGLVRNMEISRGVNLLAVKGKANQISQSDNYQNPIVGMYIMNYFNNGERGTSYAKQQVLGELVKDIHDTGISTIPLITQDEDSILKIGGAAVIKNYELIGWLDRDDVRGQLFIDGSVKQVPIVVDYQGETLTYQIEQEERSINFSDRGKLECQIDIIAKGSIIEYISSNSKYVFNQDKVTQIAELIQNQIKEQVESTITKSKELNTDFLNIGLELYRKYPKLWKDYGVNWNETGYKALPVQINVNAIIQNTGILE